MQVSLSEIAHVGQFNYLWYSPNDGANTIFSVHLQPVLSLSEKVGGMGFGLEYSSHFILPGMGYSQPIPSQAYAVTSHQLFSQVMAECSQVSWAVWGRLQLILTASYTVTTTTKVSWGSCARYRRKHRQSLPKV